MNKRNLALLISKHPLLRKLTEDKTIPNSVVARLIVEEMDIEEAAKPKDNIATKVRNHVNGLLKANKTLEEINTSIEKIRPQWTESAKKKAGDNKETQRIFLDWLERSISKHLERAAKQIVLNQKKADNKDPNDIKGAQKELETANKETEAQDAAIEKKEQEISQSQEDSEESDVLEDLAFYMGLAAAPISFVPGVGQAAGTALSIGSDLLTTADIIKDIKDGKTGEATTKLMGIIGANIAAGLIPGGIAAKESGEAAAKAAGKSAFAKTAGFLSKKLNKEITEKAVKAAVEKAAKAAAKETGGKIGKMISVKAQEYAKKQAKEINDDDELKKSIVDQGKDILGDAWDKFSGMFTNDDNAATGPRSLAKEIADELKAKKVDIDWNLDEPLNLVLQNVNLEPEVEEKIKSAAEDKKKKLEDEIQDELGKPQEPGKEEETSTTDPERFDVDPELLNSLIEASETFIDEFYEKAFLKDQGVLLTSVLTVLAKIVEKEELEKAARRTSKPTEQPEETEETETLQEEEEQPRQDPVKLRNIQVDLKSFIKLVKRSKDVLKAFDEFRAKGKVVGSSYKEKFMNILKQLQKNIKALVRDISTLNLISEKKDVSETENKWSAIEKGYNEASRSLSNIVAAGAENIESFDMEKNVNDAYTSLMSISGFFPSVNPFGAKTTKFNEYNELYTAAVKNVKSTIRDALELAKGKGGSNTANNTIESLKEFSGQIQSIFGIPSEFEDVQVKPNEPAAEGDPEVQKTPTKKSGSLEGFGSIMTNAILKFLGDNISTSKDKREILRNIDKQEQLDEKAKEILSGVVKTYKLTELQETAGMSSEQIQLYIQLLVKLEEDGVIKLTEEIDSAFERNIKTVIGREFPEQSEELLEILELNGVKEHLKSLYIGDTVEPEMEPEEESVFSDVEQIKKQLKVNSNKVKNLKTTLSKVQGIDGKEELIGKYYEAFLLWYLMLNEKEELQEDFTQKIPQTSRQEFTDEKIKKVIAKLKAMNSGYFETVKDFHEDLPPNIKQLFYKTFKKIFGEQKIDFEINKAFINTFSDKLNSKIKTEPGETNYEKIMASKVPESLGFSKFPQEEEVLKLFKWYQANNRGLSEEETAGQIVTNTISEDYPELDRMITRFIDEYLQKEDSEKIEIWIKIMERTAGMDAQTSQAFIDYLLNPIKKEEPVDSEDDKEDSKPSLEEMIEFLNDMKDDIVLIPAEGNKKHIVTKIEKDPFFIEEGGDGVEIHYEDNDEKNYLTASKDSIEEFYNIIKNEDDTATALINIYQPDGKNSGLSFKLIKPLGPLAEDEDTSLSERIEKLIKPLIKEMLTKGK